MGDNIKGCLQLWHFDITALIDKLEIHLVQSKVSTETRELPSYLLQCSNPSDLADWAAAIQIHISFGLRFRNVQYGSFFDR